LHTRVSPLFPDVAGACWRIEGEIEDLERVYRRVGEGEQMGKAIYRGGGVVESDPDARVAAWDIRLSVQIAGGETARCVDIHDRHQHDRQESEE